MVPLNQGGQSFHVSPPAEGNEAVINHVLYMRFGEIEKLREERVDDFEKGKPVKIRIPCADLPNSVLPHEDRRVSVVQEVAGEVREFRNDLPSNLGVSLRRDEDIETG